MGAALSNYVLFPAGPATYDAFLPHLIWIEYNHRDDPASSESCPDAEIIPGLLFQAVGGSAHTLLYFHGNSCDLGEMHEELLTLHEFLKCNVVAFEYPGYGLSQRRLERNVAEGIDRRGRFVFQWLTKRGIKPQNIVLFGRSIGTGPALSVALLMREMGMDPGGVVLHSPYKSIHEIVAEYARAGPLFIPNRWDNMEVLNKLSPDVPLLVIHGQTDSVIPFCHGKDLFDNYDASEFVKQAFFPEDSEHNSYRVLEDLGVPISVFLAGRSRSREANPRMCILQPQEARIPVAFQKLPPPKIRPSRPMRSFSVPVDTAPYFGRLRSPASFFHAPARDITGKEAQEALAEQEATSSWLSSFCSCDPKWSRKGEEGEIIVERALSDQARRSEPPLSTQGGGSQKFNL